VGDQQLRTDFSRLHGLQQHGRRGNRVHQTRSDRDVPVPQPLEVEVYLDAVHADIGDRAARRDDILASDAIGLVR
jgi:hypothetical protein